MKKYVLIAMGLMLCLPAHGQQKSTAMNNVAVWYDIFNKREPALAQQVVSEDWIDIPAAPGQPSGRKGVEFILDDLSRAFPDFTIIPAEILRDGNKVVVRSELTGTQRAQFMGFPAKNRRMAIQTIDIHEFKEGAPRSRLRSSVGKHRSAKATSPWLRQRMAIREFSFASNITDTNSAGRRDRQKGLAALPWAR
jgi:steroid delta-isomerase-like uncharacterized protein